MIRSFAAAAVASTALGVLQAYLGVVGGSYLSAYLTDWILGLGIRGYGFLVAHFCADFLSLVVLSLPVAAILVRLQPRKLPTYLALAVLPAVAWYTWDLVSRPLLGVPWGISVVSTIQTLVAPLPAAVCLLRALGLPRAPNNSFKPKPLRGSA